MNDARDLVDGRHVAIVGAGLVGSGWAVVFARAGLRVKVFDSQAETQAGALRSVHEQLTALERHGLLAEPAAHVLARVSCEASLELCVDGAAYVQESTFERLDVKQALMRQLDATLSADAVVGSSTSGIPASAFASGLRISPQVLIAHPVNPPSLIPLVELVPAPATSARALAFATALMTGVGQSVVHVRKEVDGFVLNRLQAVLLREAWALVEDGVASCEDIDKTIRDGLGWRWSFMGPFETIDLNAPGGVADYARRLGPLYRSIAASRAHAKEWSEELIKDVESQRRQELSAESLAERRRWRDDRLAEFAAARDRREGS